LVGCTWRKVSGLGEGLLVKSRHQLEVVEEVVAGEEEEEVLLTKGEAPLSQVS